MGLRKFLQSCQPCTWLCEFLSGFSSREQLFSSLLRKASEGINVINIVGDEAEDQVEEGFGRVPEIPLLGVREDEMISLLSVQCRLPCSCKAPQKSLWKTAGRASASAGYS